MKKKQMPEEKKQITKQGAQYEQNTKRKWRLPVIKTRSRKETKLSDSQSWSAIIKRVTIFIIFQFGICTSARNSCIYIMLVREEISRDISLRRYFKKLYLCLIFIGYSVFFLTTKWYSITETWSGLGNQIGTEQPIKCSFLWEDLAVLAKKSVIWFCARGIE